MHIASSYHFLYFLSILLVCCQSPGDLPEIYLDATDSLNFQRKNPCLFSCYEPALKVMPLEQIPAKARLRGGVSSAHPKHSFTIKLSQPFPLGGMKENNNWIINAAYIDKTFMRHKICYDLFNSFSHNNIAPHCSYMNLFIDRQYNGLYLLMERMDATRLGIDRSDSTGFIFKDPPLFRNPVDSFASESPEPNDYFHQKYPKPDSLNKNHVLHSLQQFLFFSPDSVFAHPQTGIQTIFDIDNLIDWHILVTVTNNGDGLLKNFYLYKQSASGLIKIAPWDYDHSLGRDGDGALNFHEVIDARRLIIFKRLAELNVANYRERVKNRFQQLKSNGVLTTVYLNQLIEDNYQLIKSEIPRNRSLWPDASQFYKDDAGFETEIIIMKRWIELHLPRAERQIEQL